MCADNGKVRVNISVTVEDIFDLDEVKSLITLEIQLKISWKDTRLSFKKMKDESHENIITEYQKSRLWMPSLIFDNFYNTEVILDDSGSLGMIQLIPGAKSHYAPLTQLNNNKIYAGSEGYLLHLL